MHKSKENAPFMQVCNILHCNFVDMKEVYDTDDVLRRFDSYLMLERGLTQNTVNAYNDDVTKLLGYLKAGNLKFTEATEDDLHNFLSGLHDIGISPRSQARILLSIKTSLSVSCLTMSCHSL